MPRLKTFDKKTSTTYALVHRPQHDPLIHDSDAPSQIFKEIPSSSRQLKQSKIKRRGDLEEEFGLEKNIRDNEGEAAEHGIYYDDSSYDYMQHMRELGGNLEATWIEAPKTKNKGKVKQSLEDALSEVSLDDDTRSLGGESYASSYGGNWVTGSDRLDRNRYQAQQDVPDELAGFHPDMDPRLREVLEALEDEEYVDDDDELFTALAGDRKGEMEREEWEYGEFDEDDVDWESDTTEKPVKALNSKDDEQPLPFVPARAIPHPDHNEAGIPSEDSAQGPSIPEPTAEDQDFLANFSKSKADRTSLPKLKKTSKPADLASSSVLTSSTAFGRRKKRKGALTSESGFSMTSSSLARTEPLNLLDSRFDKIAESYLEDGPMEDDDNVSMASGMTGLSKMSGMSRASAWGGSQMSSTSSQAPQLMPANFDSVMDDFLGGTDGDKKYRPMRKAGAQGRWAKDQGLKQLDEIRQGLGPARVSGGTRTQAT